MNYSSTHLPASIIELNDWQLIQVSGPDAKSYLQGQFTNDINKLTTEHYQFAAHCDPKGKVLSNMLLIKNADDTFYIERKSVTESQLADLKKYAVFSKVTMNLATQFTLSGLAGKSITSMLSDIFHCLPNEKQSVINTDFEGQTVILIRLPLPTERFIMLTDTPTQQKIKSILLSKGINESSSDQWLALDIEAGYPIIDQANFTQFLPQAISLEKIEGISFDKGCYRGQEMVARAQFKGANKRALFHLSGHAKQLPLIGENIEMRLGDNWRETGQVLAAAPLADNQIWVQIVLNNDTEHSTRFRVKSDPDSELYIVEHE